MSIQPLMKKAWKRIICVGADYQTDSDSFANVTFTRSWQKHVAGKEAEWKSLTATLENVRFL